MPALAAAAALLLLAAGAAARTVPQTNTTLATRACQPPYDKFVFCDTSRSLDERVDDLITQVWAANASAIPFLLTARNGGHSAIPSIGLPEYDWGLNAIHGAQTTCVELTTGETKCPTSFMNPVNYGTAWNDTLAWELGAIIATQTRALWLIGADEQNDSPSIHIGLDAWSPNININRDVRRVP